MNRHPDDKPKLIKNEQEFIDYVNEEMTVYFYSYVGDKDPQPSTYKKYNPWIEHPLEYPCLVFSRVEDVDFTPGWDFHTEFIYLEDARELYVAKFLGE